MTYVIDSITHSTTTAQVAKDILARFMSSDEKLIHVVMLPVDAKMFSQRLRVNITRMWTENKIPRHERVGVRISEPFPYSFGDDREGVFTCICVTPYHSQFRSMAKIMNSRLAKELALDNA